MLTVHHLGISQSERIVWLCEELEIPYELVRYERNPVTRLAPSAYKALHPSGTAPVIVDNELVLAETGAVIDYIVAVHGDGRLILGPEHPDFARYLYWYHFGNGSMVPSMMLLSASGFMAEVAKQRVDRALQTLEAHLTEHGPWLAGQTFSVADIMMVFPLTTMRAFFPVDLAPFLSIRAYLRRISDRPAFVRAVAKADPGRIIERD